MPKNEPETRLIGYARVSSEDQNLDMQVAALKRAGVLDDNMHVDKASGVSKRRPGLRLAIMDCREGDTLVVWKLDRLTRSPPELYALVDRLKEKGVGLRSLTEMLDTTTSIGRLVMGITTVVAGFERDLIAERTKAGLAAIKEKREENGEEWDWGRKAVLTEAQVVKIGELLNRKKNPLSGPEAAERYKVSSATIYGHYGKNKSGRGPRLGARIVDASLRRHKHVIVRFLPGNHDEHAAVALAYFISAWYRNEPRVTVDLDPSLFWWHRFGSVMLGATHGHTVKIGNMPQIMAHRRAEDWGATKFRYIHGFHLHHAAKTMTEGGGCVTEVHQAPVPQDAWHYGAGFLSGRSLQSISYHREWGEIGRVRVSMMDAETA